MTAINLQQFCATHDVRRYLHQPFVIDGYTHATDGRILVRVPGGGDDSDVPSKLVQSVRKLFAAEYTDFAPLPESIPERVECTDCHGSGVDDEDDACYACSGTGETPHVVEIGASTFLAHFVRMIAALPNPRISVLSRVDPAAFVFDGGEGRFMPYIQRSER